MATPPPFRFVGEHVRIPFTIRHRWLRARVRVRLSCSVVRVRFGLVATGRAFGMAARRRVGVDVAGRRRLAAADTRRHSPPLLEGSRRSRSGQEVQEHAVSSTGTSYATYGLPSPISVLYLQIRYVTTPIVCAACD